jgi:predicted O-methyltransferase YrrM
MENNLDSLWVEASNRKIQQIKEEWEWLYLKVRERGYRQNILEIGCYDGGSSWYLSGLAENMITIDNNIPCRFDPSTMRCDNYQYIGGDSHQPSMSKHFGSYNWNFVFIDGDHSFEGVKADFYNVLPFLSKGTPVAFHDIVISDFHHTHGCYVGEFWEELKNEYNATKFEEFKTSDEWAGIGVVWI